MRTVPAAITAARQSSVSRLCKIWELTRLDGTVYRFTEHDRDIEVDGDTFYATASFDPSSIKGAADMSVSDMDVVGAFDTEYISARDLLGGVYHGASFWVGEVLWDAPDEGVDILQFGWLGRVRETGGKFVAELLGPGAMLQQTIGEVYSPVCRATLGDSRCNAQLSAWHGTVTSVTSRRVFEQTGIAEPEAGYFIFGKVVWTSGENADAAASMDVQAMDGAEISLFMPMPFDVSIGDTFTLYAGCDKRLATCRDKFDNVLNFRGEPHVPVSDDLIRGPGPDTPRSGGSSSDVTPDPAPEPDVPTITGSPTISTS